ncbi:mechanosensitive ion channel family protein [Dechloromonas sp. H13]|uniref:mechanosensitive ion channel family protein n=1 Tax=Dechloromonas sp. H13 TaxID=2570193 RepID=UPI001290AB0B|nr:mechanosensitive ion channel family protein [Dechloromonas sp. H13]
MNTIHRMLRCMMLLAVILAPWPLLAKEAAAPEAVLTIANRDIATLRMTALGGSPELRVRRIHERLRQLDENELSKPITRSHLTIEGQKGVVYSIGERNIFVLYEGDLDPEEKMGLEETSQQVGKRFEQAIAALIEQGHGPVVARGLLFSILATALMVVLLWGIRKATTLVLDRLQEKVLSANEDTRLRWAAQGWLLVKRIAQLLLLTLWLSVAYLWFTYVLANFPLTQPLAERLSGFLVNMLEGFGEGLVTSVPGLLTVGVILFITKAANDVAGNVFQNVYQGRSLIPGVHRDTAHATRRLLGVLIWAVGIAIAYPYLPVADSEAFKGLSVMFGFMLTLGSAGIVTQLMSGLVLIYSRALKVGDFVSIGEVTGVVKEMSALSTKIINMRNEEVTIPNAVLVNNPIKNFTGAAGERGTLISTTVTIGYDTPWRQVHAMLINAAERTSGLRSQPKPFVMQKALQDFYVEYEIYAYVDRPLERIQILSELHSQIQDEFNTYGVQIMSPNFVLQPKNNVVVGKEQWFAEPAEKP